MRLIGSSDTAAVLGVGETKGRSNYMLGSDPSRWIRAVPNYSQVRYHQIYDGTDLVFYGKEGSLEHDFELEPNANPSRIAFKIDGANHISLNTHGDLKIHVGGETVVFSRPIAYQIVSGRRLDVQAAFALGPDGAVHFRLGKYDRAAKLVIDPVLTFATYISPLASAATRVATDAQGNNYIVGYASLGFPTTSGSFAGCTTCSGNSSVTFISKLSADGSSLVYSTVLGGNSFAQPTGMAVDKSGNVIVSGFTGASDFPTKNGQPIAPPNNAYLGFLVSLSADGSSLNYGTMLGSAPTTTLPATTTYASAVTVDGTGNAYVAGETGSGFYVSPGALNQVAATGSISDTYIYLAKFSPTGALIYSAILGTADPQNGGGGPIGASAITVDASGNAFVAGQAGTLWPITSGAYLSQVAGPYPYATPFVTKVAPDAKSLIYSTYLDYAYVVTGIVGLSNGNVFVTGDSAGANYPTTQNAFQQNSGVGSAFLTELNSTGSALVYSTVIGDSTYKINGIALDPDSNIWLAGQTSDPQFPMINPLQSTFPVANGFGPGPASTLSEFDPSGQTLRFSTFLGGSAVGYASSVAVDSARKVHVSGAAGYGMPTTPGAYDASVPTPAPGYSGATYAYLAEVDPTVASGALCFGGSAGTGISFGYVPLQTTTSQTVQVRNCGQTSLSFSSITSTNAAFSVLSGTNACSGSLAAGAGCSVTVQFAPTAAQDYSGLLKFASDASPIPISVYLAGSGGVPVVALGPASGSFLIFPEQLLGQTGQVQTIQLANNGTVPLTISSTTVTSGFALASGTCPSTLQAHQSCWIAVEFAPTVAGQINGTLSVSSNDPVNPTITASLQGTALATYPIPTVTALLNPSYPINSGTAPISMGVFGMHFFPTSVVYINGAAQTTSYNDNSYLTVTFSSSLLNTAGPVSVTVFNPTPGGGSSAPYPLIAYRSSPITASALVSDPVGGLLYASIPGSAAQNPNTIIPIDPTTGAQMTPIPVSSDPQRLAISDDGSELYVATTAGVLQRINLKSLVIEKTFNLPVDSEWGQTYAQEMHVVPGTPKSIVVALFAHVDPSEDGAALYNDSGLVNWLPGQRYGTNQLQMDSFTFTSSSLIYGLPKAGSFFTQVQVAPTGLTYTGAGVGQVDQQSGSKVRSDGTLLYTNSGQVWDPSAQSLLGTYLESDGSQLFYAASVLPGKGEKRSYFLDQFGSYSDYEALNIDVYDQASYALLGSVPFVDIDQSDAADLVRWGTNGFAFRTENTTVTNSPTDQIVIVKSDLVTATGAAPIPILSSVVPATVTAGGPAFTMQLTGSGFTQASTVFVNGSSRTTTYVSSTSLTAQVPASDIAATGQLNVQVVTPAPGGGASNYQSVLIQAAQQVTPAVIVTPSSSSILKTQPLTVTVTVNGGNTKPTPTGSVVLTGGGFTSASVGLTGGQATINVPAGSLNAGMDTLSVTYSPDGSSAATFNSAVGTASVTVTAVGTTASTVNIAPASTTITNLQTDAISITVAGASGQPTPTGIVTLASGSYSAQQALSSGSTTITIPAGALSSGANTVTATYLGDGTFAGSSSTVTITVAQVVSSAAAPAGVTPGGSTTSTVTLNAGNNYSGTLNMSCALLSSPSGAQSLPTCSLSPTTVNIATGSTGSTVLTVKTTAASTSAQLKPANLFGLGGGTTLAGILLILVPARRRRWVMLALLICIAVGSSVIGCGGGSSSAGSGSGGTGTPATTAGTYRFSISGVDSANPNIKTSTTVDVTVQ